MFPEKIYFTNLELIHNCLSNNYLSLFYYLFYFLFQSRKSSIKLNTVPWETEVSMALEHLINMFFLTREIIRNFSFSADDRPLAASS